MYRYYKKEFFPKLLQDAAVSNEDKEKIKALLTKPWNPYVRRHTGATEKSGMLNDSKLRQYGGWSPNSKMPQVYTHYFGNESSKSLLEAYYIIPKNSSGGSVELLSPKICPHCKEGNTVHAKFCVKCRMVLTLDDYYETLEQQREKELQMQRLQEKYEQDMTVLKQQVEENKKAQSDIFNVVAGLRKHLGIPDDKNIVWDWTKTKQGRISFFENQSSWTKKNYANAAADTETNQS
jgi:hypothetical protein